MAYTNDHTYDYLQLLNMPDLSSPPSSSSTGSAALTDFGPSDLDLWLNADFTFDHPLDPAVLFGNEEERVRGGGSGGVVAGNAGEAKIDPPQITPAQPQQPSTLPQPTVGVPLDPAAAAAAAGTLQQQQLPNPAATAAPAAHATATPTAAQPATSAASPQTPAPRFKDEEELDKRRRNTAASARFRAKKKQREQLLEKTAKEMTEKAEMLERRVKEYEMELKWLRQIVTERDSKKRLREVYEENGLQFVEGTFAAGSGPESVPAVPAASVAAAAAVFANALALAQTQQQQQQQQFLQQAAVAQQPTGLSLLGMGLPLGGLPLALPLPTVVPQVQPQVQQQPDSKRPRIASAATR
ncbi:hypothetical protein HK104_005022, partial [Borealophlyctis nickersoniae]